MPFFGKSSSKKSQESKVQAYGQGGNAGVGINATHYPSTSAYPTQQQASQYPHQYNPPAPSAPIHSSSYGATYGAPPVPPYGNEPPPPYSNPVPHGAAFPPPQYTSAYPSGSGYPITGQPPMYQAQPQTVYCSGALDAGARQGPMSTQAVPPPPPGCPPNQAQLAAMQGHNVVITQRKENWFTGGEGGGYTLW